MCLPTFQCRKSSLRKYLDMKTRLGSTKDSSHCNYDHPHAITISIPITIPIAVPIPIPMAQYRTRSILEAVECFVSSHAIRDGDDNSDNAPQSNGVRVYVTVSPPPPSPSPFSITITITITIKHRDIHWVVHWLPSPLCISKIGFISTTISISTLLELLDLPTNGCKMSSEGSSETHIEL